MNNQECDRLIDRAAAQIVAREPGRALTRAVMASVREPEAPVPGRFIWATAAATAVLCGAIAIAVVNRTPAPATQAPAPARPLVVQLAVVTAAPPVLRPETARARPAVAVTVANQRSSPVLLPPNDVSAIDPLETEPISVSAIEVPPIENQTTSIADIGIGDLTIDPLAASND